METSTMIALGALLISFLGLVLNSRKDTRTDAASNAITQTKLDNLITGYEQQLDQMFDSDAMDISSDIDVLETMLKQDGLNSDGSGIAMGGH